MTVQSDSPSAPLVPLESTGGAARFLPEGRQVPAGHGWQWLAEAWTLFTKQPLMWIVLLVAFVAIIVLVTLVPVVGGLAGAVLTPILLGGLMIGCREVDEDRSLAIEQLFAGFRLDTQQLAMVGVFHLLAYVVILLVIAAIIAAGMATGGMTGANMNMGLPGVSGGALAGGTMSMLLAGLIGTALAIPVYAAMWFAPALIVFHHLAPVPALKTSFFAVFRNILPMLVNGAILMILAFIASIPFGLGFLVLLPVVVATIYCAYRDLFFAPAPLDA